MAWTAWSCDYGTTQTSALASEPLASGTTSPELVSVPNMPSAVSATALSSSEIRIDWADSSNNEDGFRITDSERVLTLPADTTSYLWTGFQPGTYKCIRVQAYNDAGASDWTEWVCATTPEVAAQTTTTSGTTVQRYTVTVKAAEPSGTYVTDVYRGDIIRVISANGTWSSGGTKTDGTPAIGGPEGIREPYSYEVDEMNYEGFLVGELIVRAASSSCVCSATACKNDPLTSESGGRLELGMNDRWGYYDDNSGSVEVVLEITRMSALGPKWDGAETFTR